MADFVEGKLFMPALLPVLEEGEVQKYRVSADSPAAALALDFPLGGPRLGTFCTLACFLVSHNNQSPCPWKIVLLPHSNTPACLYRNSIRFSIPDFPGHVTLIDTFTHFEVHVHTLPSSMVASFVGLQSHSHLYRSEASHPLALGYNNSIPSAAILCPCSAGNVRVFMLPQTTERCLDLQQGLWELWRFGSQALGLGRNLNCH